MIDWSSARSKRDQMDIYYQIWDFIFGSNTFQSFSPIFFLEYAEGGASAVRGAVARSTHLVTTAAL